MPTQSVDFRVSTLFISLIGNAIGHLFLRSIRRVGNKYLSIFPSSIFWLPLGVYAAAAAAASAASAVKATHNNVAFQQDSIRLHLTEERTVVWSFLSI